ncbi:MAG TPA: glutamate racemase [Polyangiales bacterium]
MPQPSHTAPIGVFDSGLGGLTVVRAIQSRLPHEDIVYLGDTARVPYGTRSPQTVLNYARACAKKLCEHDIKLLCVACNTVSAVAIEMLSVELDLPVLGVIGPGARAGVAASSRGRVGVIATAGTVLSGAYPREMAAVSTRTETFMNAAPLLVPLVEEGWVEGEVPRLAVRRYLSPLVAQNIDTLVLGCTHYPLLREVIESELQALTGHSVPVVDSAQATASELHSVLADRRLATQRPSTGQLRILVTDMPGRFSEVAARFLGRSVEGLDVTAIDL